MLGAHGRTVTTTVFTPVATGLAKLHITPNVITIAGTVITVAVAVVVLGRGYLWQGALTLGVVLLLDSLDGVLARATGRTSAFGAFLDSTLDRLGDGAVFGSLTAWAAFGMPNGPVRTVSVVAGLVAMVGAAAVPYARARAATIGVDAKLGIAERTDRLIIGLLGAFLTGLGLSGWLYAAGLCWVAFASLVTVAQRVWFTGRHLRRGGATSEAEAG